MALIYQTLRSTLRARLAYHIIHEVRGFRSAIGDHRDVLVPFPDKEHLEVSP